ncbi:MAG: hypothetical protein E5X63_10575 [Mesorhizobium sp.]|nr:MAG: hypothetical protein E5X63_10575 [Mesorhizobium sp.]
MEIDMPIKGFFVGLSLAGTGILASAVAANAAPQWTSWGQVTQIEAGWAVDAAAIRHSSAGVVNPSGCSTTDYGYMTSPEDTGHNWFHAVALSALVSGKPVALLIDGCFAGKPRIISIKIVP